MKIATICGFSMDNMSLNGVGRSNEYQEASVNEDIHINFLDSIDDIKKLARLAADKGKKLNVGLRVNPPQIDNSLYIKESNKLGLDWEGGHFLLALQEINKYPQLNLKGILCHQFYHLTDPDKFRTLLRKYVDIIKILYQEHDQKFEIIDIGGGFETRFLMDIANVSIEDFARISSEILSDIPYEFMLQAQPGRYLTADTAVAFTTITSDKNMSQNNWLITDVGSNILVPIPGLVYHPLPTSIRGNSKWRSYNLGDGTCAPSSVCKEAELPPQKVGEQLLLLNCGAYTTVFAQIWAFPLPQILVMRENKKIETVFSRQNFCEMVQAFYGYEL